MSEALSNPGRGPIRGRHGNRHSARAAGPVWLAAIVSLLLAAGSRAAEEPLQHTFESGPVVVRVQLAPPRPLIGDPVTLTLTVEAQRDVEVLMPEFGEALERFAIIDYAPRESIDADGRATFVQRYRLQPPASGKQAIPPILIEYVDRRPGSQPAPEGLDAYELLTERLEFEVQSVLPTDVEVGLKPPLGRLPPPPQDAPRRWLWMAALAAVAAVLASPWVVRAWLARRRQARRLSAYQIARARLDRLLAGRRPDAADVDPFYVELSAIVRQYLEDRFELRAPELTTEEFLASFGQSPDLSPDHQALLREFLRQADLVKFAGVRPAVEDIDQSLQAARRFLEETRETREAPTALRATP